MYQMFSSSSQYKGGFQAGRNALRRRILCAVIIQACTAHKTGNKGGAEAGAGVRAQTVLKLRNRWEMTG